MRGRRGQRFKSHRAGLGGRCVLFFQLPHRQQHFPIRVLEKIDAHKLPAKDGKRTAVLTAQVALIFIELHAQADIGNAVITRLAGVVFNIQNLFLLTDDVSLRDMFVDFAEIIAERFFQDQHQVARIILDLAGLAANFAGEGIARDLHAANVFEIGVFDEMETAPLRVVTAQLDGQDENKGVLERIAILAQYAPRRVAQFDPFKVVVDITLI